ncbi:MAG: glycosylase [Candidatus Brocadiia bacterium]
MTVERLFNRCLLRPEDLEPSREDFRVIGAFNPGAARCGDEIVLMVRVAEAPAEQREGMTGLPRWTTDGTLTVDWLPDEALALRDPRMVRVLDSGTLRLTFVSHIRIYTSPHGRAFEPPEVARFEPRTELETYGVEDPRIVPIGDEFYVTYVAVSQHGAATALATTADFRTFRRHGVIFCPENKDVVLFSRRIGGRLTALHRPNPSLHFSPPGIWLADSDDGLHWGGHRPLHAGSAEWETGRIGAGTPPIETERGWLEIYHGASAPTEDTGVGVYSAGALLLARDEPAEVLGRSAEPVLRPEEDFETAGFVSSVVFPTGIVPLEDTFLLYYGAADTNTAVVELSREELMASIT